MRRGQSSVNTATLIVVLLATAVGAQEPQREKAPRPGDVGQDKEGTVFQLPKVELVERQPSGPSVVESFEVWKLAAGTHVGNPGDLVVEFKGRGFLLTARGPLLIVGEELEIDHAEINADGTRVYVVLDEEARAAIESRQFDSVTLWTAGGSTKVEASPERLLRPADPDRLMRLLYRKGAFDLVSGQDEGESDG